MTTEGCVELARRLQHATRACIDTEKVASQEEKPLAK
jgi:hypothetical protein